MSNDYRGTLFNRYDVRTSALDADQDRRRAWFHSYATRAYLPSLEHVNRATAQILEIGCSKGLFLSVLDELGFRNLTGVDLSPGDVETATRAYPEIEFVCQDASQFLRAHPETFDVVVLKAVLEHIKKEEVLGLLEAIRDSLRQGGTVVVDVPNMDWLFAGHERYMDFTHENGFTSESLRQVVGEVFPNVQIRSVDNDLGTGLRRLATRAVRRIAGAMLGLADPDARGLPLWHRSLVAVADRADAR